MKILRTRSPAPLCAVVLGFLGLVAAQAGTITATSTGDADGICPGPSCTLRQAIASAVSGDTINFAPDLAAITLTSGDLLINKNLTISGPGANLLTVQRSAGAALDFRIFTISGVTVNISGLTIANGRAPQGGGGIYNDGSVLTITSCTISGNFGGGGGAGGILNQGTVMLIRSSISGNSASVGAGISSTGAATFVNTTVSGNTQSDLGGGIYCGGGTVSLTNSTVAANSANDGGGVYQDAGTINVRNTIIAGNTATNGPDFYGTLTSQGYDIIGNTKDTVITTGANGTTTGNQVNIDPGLGPLRDNGGPTKTHNPVGGSKAIDKGHSSGSNTDQRGQPRPVDRPDTNAAGGDASDIGAVELAVSPQQTGPTFTVTTTLERNQGFCTVDDCSLIEALNETNKVADANTINFAPGLTGAIGTAILTPSGLAITNPVTIKGPGARILTVTGRTAARVFRVTSPGVSISGLSMVNGRVTNAAGGIIHNTGGLTLTDCTLDNGFASGTSGDGGALYNGLGATLTVNGCTVSGSTADHIGGGIFNEGTLTATNCTFSGDSAIQGGGIYSAFSNNASKVSLRNCTIAQCYASDAGLGTGDGGGGWYAVGNSGQYNLGNSIIANNTAARNPDLRGNFFSDGHNFIGNVGFTSGLSNNVNGDQVGTPGGTKDPLLFNLDDASGPTDTHALMTASTARNAGDDSLAPPQDQRGYGRNGVSDIGAFEWQGVLPVTLANLSTRLRVETGDNVLIGGFIITGGQLKKVIIRAIGPSLPLPGSVANPTLELYQGSTLIASNDDWQNQPAADRQAVIDSTIPPSNDLESALVRTLVGNNFSYTAVVRGASSGTGIGVVEVYDLDRTENSKLANISTRGLVQTGDNVLIAGTIVVGTQSQKVIVRAIGPSLPLAGKLENPTLELRDSNGGVVESNDNWIDSPNKQAIIDSTIPPSNDLESAIVRTLTPAAYTAIVRGVNDTSGIAVVEVYALP
jgi:hypothetical protein